MPNVYVRGVPGETLDTLGMMAAAQGMSKNDFYRMMFMEFADPFSPHHENMVKALDSWAAGYNRVSRDIPHPVDHTAPTVPRSLDELDTHLKGRK